jgi:hypothetical protein
MAQLTMVDQARLSLRPQTQFVIESYGDKRDSDTGGVLNLIKGTLRTFTGLLAASNREKFVMKTRVATVGIRGSGNILYACDDKECDESVVGAANCPGRLAHGQPHHRRQPLRGGHHGGDRRARHRTGARPSWCPRTSPRASSRRRPSSPTWRPT